MKILVIEKRKIPRFSGVPSLFMVYKVNRNAWMTTTRFTERLMNIDKEMGKKEKENCNDS